jgi:hypothetical protein
MKEKSTNWWLVCTNITLSLGVVSLACALTAKFDLFSSVETIKPIVIVVFIGVFPLFFLFIIKQIEDSRKENKRQKDLSFFKSIIDSFEDTLNFWKEIPRIYLFASVALFVLSAQTLYPFSSTHYSTSIPFLKEHAVGLSAGASLFYAIMLPYFSNRSANDSLFEVES